MGRGAESLRWLEARSLGHRRRADRLVPRAPGALQVSQACRVRPAAAHRYRQDPQERTARQGKGKLMNIQIAHEGPIAIVTLNRPERRNALSLELMLDLIAALEEIGRNREIRAVILAASQSADYFRVTLRSTLRRFRRIYWWTERADA